MIPYSSQAHATAFTNWMKNGSVMAQSASQPSPTVEPGTTATPEVVGEQLLYKSDAARKAKARSKQVCCDVFIDKVTDERDTYRGWVFKTTYDNMGTGPVFSEEYQQFEHQLTLFANKKHEKKTDNTLICPSFFDAKPRKRDNIVFANGIWLDMDGTKNGKPPISLEAFAALFPHVRMTIFNSYSSTHDWPRYRVLKSPRSWKLHRETRIRSGRKTCSFFIYLVET
jgi:hypothetical protein